MESHSAQRMRTSPQRVGSILPAALRSPEADRLFSPGYCPAPGEPDSRCDLLKWMRLPPFTDRHYWDERNAAVDAYEKERRKQHASAIMHETGCPVLHQDWIAEMDGTDWSAAGQDWLREARNVIGLIGQPFVAGLVGQRGTGKTQMAVVMAWTASRRGIRSRYVTARSLLVQICRPVRFNEEPDDRVRRFLTPPLLIIDEINSTQVEAKHIADLTDLVDRRYAAKRGTLLISNELETQFEKLVGASVWSRMQETGGVLVCNWPSFRLPESPF